MMKLIDTPKLLNCHFKNGMMMLPYYHSIIEARLNSQTFAGEGAKRAPIKQQLYSLLKGLRYCRVMKKDILIFSSTLFNVKRNGAFYNCLHGYYYDLYPDKTMLVEDGDSSFMWRTKDSCGNLSFINTYIEILCLVLQKVCHALAPLHTADYVTFINEYPTLFSAKKLSKDDYYTRFYAYFIKKLLKAAKPKVILVNCGSYGHNAAVICYVAKQLGIKVIEPQHGETYKNTGYVTSGFIANSQEYAEYLPDTLFSFGNYWNELVDWKYEKISVGYQYLNEYAQLLKNTQTAFDFLIISQPMDKEKEKEKIAFVKRLCSIYPGKKILFRIHPAENFKQQQDIYKNCYNLEISNSTKVLYEDFNRCKYIIGWFSSCMYECLAFKRVPIIVDTEYTRNAFPNNLGVWIKEPSDLETLDLETLSSTIDYTMFWANDFNNKVKEYIDKLL